MFSRKSKADKELERMQKQQAEEAKKSQELIAKAAQNRNDIIQKHRDKLQPELSDGDIITFSYSNNEKVVVAVYPDRIRLRSFQKALLSTGLRGEKTIYLNRITSIQLKEPGLTTGYIQFKTGGESESRSSTMDAVKDENSVTFNHDQVVEFKRLRKIIEDQIQRLHSGNTSPAQTSKADELAKLAALRDQGILTDQEFEDQKKRILT